ncbi:hypothetical protein H2508_04595 [Parahaliea sp. F7430]|uniref:Uncharacterized protein n=1 Tax=Sediminihaliea albiluteola TaxID=2758564 RepID=A0A7W2YIR2_9GAMM|nr:hypothetical protein [Sediminihaliea albiluteola]MBA6412385.1 hypothetical protein [Sediminihaliea albiluteola]
MKAERAEAGTRVSATAEDRKYKGIARHPLARKWMLKRLIEARDNLEAARDHQTEVRWASEVERVSGELSRCGVHLGADK